MFKEMLSSWKYICKY